MTASVSAYSCPWCRHASEGSALSCPGCGISIDPRGITSTGSGWIELPGRRDMARLQIGASSCQIEGAYVPVADFNLASGESVYFAHHSLLWADPAVQIAGMGLKGAWKRLMAGLPLIMTQAVGPGHIAFSRDAPGEIIALPLDHGQEVDVREHIFLVATGGVAYDWFNSGIWFKTREGNDTETHYPIGAFMDRFTAPKGPGLLLLHAAGNAFIRALKPGETILVKPTALLFKDPTVQMQLHFEVPRMPGMSFWRTWTHRHLWLRLHGPGRVAVQSGLKELEENGRSVVDHSGATQHQW